MQFQCHSDKLVFSSLVLVAFFKALLGLFFLLQLENRNFSVIVFVNH